MKSNVICNADFIYIGQPLIIPEPGFNLPKAGGGPYYVVNYGDTLWCLANQFSQSIESLSAANQLANPNQIYPKQELLVGINLPNPGELYEQWNIPQDRCELLNSLWIFGVFYNGSFLWEALDIRAIPYLNRLLYHPCNEVRYYAVMSLGRIGKGREVLSALQQALQDSDESVRSLASLAMKRYQLIPQWTKRVHVTVSDVELIGNLNVGSPTKRLPEGTPIVVLRWNIPSPKGEVLPPGNIATFDFVQIVETGETGYLLRAGYGEIGFI